MQKFTIAASIAAAFVVATTFATPSDAATHKHKHRVDADREQVAAAAPYGLPPNYYPAPPFPFFLIPGPWWLPAHP